MAVLLLFCGHSFGCVSGLFWCVWWAIELPFVRLFKGFQVLFFLQFGDFRHCFELLFLLFLLLFLCIWAAVLGYKTVQFTGAVSRVLRAVLGVTLRDFCAVF